MFEFPEDRTIGDWIDDAVNRQFACDHADLRLVVKVTSSAMRQYRNQCLRCGQPIGNIIKHAMITEGERSSSPPFDDGLRDAWFKGMSELRSRLWDAHKARRQAAADVYRDEEGAVWRRRYEAHINSTAWKTTRSKALVRDGHLCQGCLTNPASHVHHLTYDHFGNELLYELISLCDECHRLAHHREVLRP